MTADLAGAERRNIVYPKGYKTILTTILLGATNYVM